MQHFLDFGSGSRLQNSIKKYAFLLVLFILSVSFGNAQTTTLYDFNSSDQLSNNFNSTNSDGTIIQSTTGGLNNSGAVKLTTTSANEVFATKEGYSLGPVGSSYTFTAYLKSEGNGGYSGVGFTSSSPTTAKVNKVYKPTDALGISVHGGGFEFHNGTTNYGGSWNQNYSNDITSIKVFTGNGDLINSTTAWYKILFKITRVSSTTFNMRVEVFPSLSTGILISQDAAAIFEVNGVTNSTLQNATLLYSYFNFSGNRARYFDDFVVNLAGGASVIQQGSPVVLTTSASQDNNIVTVNGDVTSENGSTVTERGFVYGTSTAPTLSNSKVVVGSEKILSF